MGGVPHYLNLYSGYPTNRCDIGRMATRTNRGGVCHGIIVSAARYLAD